MVKSWRKWCRLCAHEDTSDIRSNIDIIKEESIEFLATVNKVFSIKITADDDLPHTICRDCHQMVTSVIAFSERSCRVQALFADLHNSEDLEALSSGPIKALYNIEKLCDEESVETIDPDELMDYEHIKTEDAGSVSENESTDRLKSFDEFHLSIECDRGESDESAKLSETKTKTRRKSSVDDKTTFICIKCDKPYKLFTNYRIHMHSEHGIDPDPSQLPVVQKQKYSCPYCDKTFVKQGWVEIHIQSAHMGEGAFVCEECGKEYKVFSHLKAHQIAHNEERPFKCKWCAKSFKSKNKMRVHSDTHRETKYVCPACGLQLNTLRTLNMHMVVHSDQRLHKCNFCGKNYKRSKALKNHLIIHSGLKPYKCNFCDKTFANGSNCRSHKKKTHPEELAEMEASGTIVIATNIPKLSHLRAVTTNKTEPPA